MPQDEFSRLEADIIKGKLSLVFRKCIECDKELQISYYAPGIVLQALCSDCSPCGCAIVNISVKAFLDKVFERIQGEINRV